MLLSSAIVFVLLILVDFHATGSPRRIPGEHDRRGALAASPREERQSSADTDPSKIRPVLPGGLTNVSVAGALANQSHSDHSDRPVAILLFPATEADRFWGKRGLADQMAHRGNSCSSKCRFTTDVPDGSELDAVLFLAATPTRAKSQLGMFRAVYDRPTTMAVLYTEKDDDYGQMLRDKQQFDLRISYSFNPDIFHGQVCGGLMEVQQSQLAKADSAYNATRRNKGIVGAISNCGAKQRNAYVKEMMQHTHIDQYGTCFRNRHTGTPRSSKNWRSGKIDLFRNYAFALSFENKITAEYVTEKIFDSILAGAIPVYSGTSDVYKYVPANAFIDVRHFDSPEALVTRLREVERNETLYASFFQWDMDEINRTIAKYGCEKPYLCQLCDRIYGDASQKRRQLGADSGRFAAAREHHASKSK